MKAYVLYDEDGNIWEVYLVEEKAKRVLNYYNSFENNYKFYLKEHDVTT